MSQIVSLKGGAGRSRGAWLSAAIVVLALVVLTSTVLVGLAATTAAAKDKITIGCAISLSGRNALGAKVSQVHVYKLWAQQVNARGGIYVKKYGKKLPVKLIFYDDASNVETCIKMIEKLIVKDKVDFMLPPWGTAFNFAVAPMVSRYHYIMIGPTISSAEWQKLYKRAPYYFIILNQPQKQAEALVNMLKDLGVKSVAMVHVADLFGLEHSREALKRLKKAGIKIVLNKGYPPAPKDLSPLIKRMMALRPDAVLAYSYPPSTFLFTKQMIALNYNPKLLFFGVGQHFADYRKAFGVKTVQGVMGLGAWNPLIKAPGAKAFNDAYKKKWGIEPPRWGEASTYASMQILEKAIQLAGDLDQKKLRRIIATRTFSTVIGWVKFVKNANPNYPGDVGQWQNGEYMIVAPKAKRQVAPIYPKPPWPKKK